eukprot:scaffold156269_cov28-Tisochrysis_lutea.AAC.4
MNRRFAVKRPLRDGDLQREEEGVGALLGLTSSAASRTRTTCPTTPPPAAHGATASQLALLATRGPS